MRTRLTARVCGFLCLWVVIGLSEGMVIAAIPVATPTGVAKKAAFEIRRENMLIRRA
ncbi:MAG: hypothetical protein KAY65_10340 [Planctomycetes bacterium]|nr:hypothetical protein [Planctomycetota bacterium]